jgi:hypothetical protein
MRVAENLDWKGLKETETAGLEVTDVAADRGNGGLSLAG